MFYTNANPGTQVNLILPVSAFRHPYTSPNPPRPMIRCTLKSFIVNCNNNSVKVMMLHSHDQQTLLQCNWMKRPLNMIMENYIIYMIDVGLCQTDSQDSLKYLTFILLMQDFWPWLNSYFKKYQYRVWLTTIEKMYSFCVNPGGLVHSTTQVVLYSLLPQDNVLISCYLSKTWL